MNTKRHIEIPCGTPELIGDKHDKKLLISHVIYSIYIYVM